MTLLTLQRDESDDTIDHLIRKVRAWERHSGEIAAERDAALTAIARVKALEPFIVSITRQLVVRVSDVRAAIAGQ